MSTLLKALRRADAPQHAPHIPAMGLPVTLVALLISVEPLIDMGRTALNVSGSITAGTVTSRLMGQTDMAVFNGDAEVSLDGEESAV